MSNTSDLSLIFRMRKVLYRIYVSWPYEVKKVRWERLTVFIKINCDCTCKHNKKINVRVIILNKREAKRC